MGIDITKLNEAVLYYPLTGALVWSMYRPEAHFKRSNDYWRYMNTQAGKPVVLSNKSQGYLHFRFGYTLVAAHIAAWILMTGQLPATGIDHRDQDPTNNRWGNLRLANKALNSRNRRKQHNNSSGHTGINWHTSTQKWMARCGTAFLGRFESIEEAIQARKHYITTNPQLGYTQLHGK